MSDICNIISSLTSSSSLDDEGMDVDDEDNSSRDVLSSDIFYLNSPSRRRGGGGLTLALYCVHCFVCGAVFNDLLKGDPDQPP